MGNLRFNYCEGPTETGSILTFNYCHWSATKDRVCTSRTSELHISKDSYINLLLVGEL
jgi:hypothetical protein